MQVVHAKVMKFDTPIDVRLLLGGDDNLVQNDTSEFTLDQIASRVLYELDENHDLTPKSIWRSEKVGN